MPINPDIKTKIDDSIQIFLIAYQKDMIQWATLTDEERRIKLGNAADITKTPLYRIQTEMSKIIEDTLKEDTSENKIYSVEVLSYIKKALAEDAKKPQFKKIEKIVVDGLNAFFDTTFKNSQKILEESKKVIAISDFEEEFKKILIKSPKKSVPVYVQHKNSFIKKYQQQNNLLAEKKAKDFIAKVQNAINNEIEQLKKIDSQPKEPEKKDLSFVANLSEALGPYGDKGKYNNGHYDLICKYELSLKGILGEDFFTKTPEDRARKLLEVRIDSDFQTILDLLKAQYSSANSRLVSPTSCFLTKLVDSDHKALKILLLGKPNRLQQQYFDQEQIMKTRNTEENRLVPSSGPKTTPPTQALKKINNGSVI